MPSSFPKNRPLPVLPSSMGAMDTAQGWPCLRCGECCRRYQVRLEPAEAEGLAGRLGLTGDELREMYGDRRWPGETSMLLRQENGGCPFLVRPAESGDELCAIHDFKPSSCREWTAGLHRSECRAGLARRWGLTVDSAGQPTGPDEKMRDFRLFVDSLGSDRRT